MIWYRHWLETRETLAVTGLTVLGLVGYLSAMTAQEALATGTGIARGIAASPLAAALDADALQAWTIYAQRVPMSAYMTALFLGGNGLRGKFLPAGSPEFVLTLPISRRRIIVTRLAVTLAAALVLETTWLAGQSVVIATTGGRVPVAQLAQTYVLALPVYVMWVAAGGAITSFLRPLWAVVAATALAVAAFVPTQLLLTSLPLNGRVAWPVLAGMFGVAALALTVTLRYAPRREC